VQPDVPSIRLVQPDAPTLTLRDYLVPVNRRKWLILALVLVITGAVVVYYARKPVAYTASTKVYVGSGGGSGGIVGASEADQAVILTSTEVAAVVAKNIGYAGSPAALAASVSAAPSATTDFMTISSTQSSAREAVDVVNGFAQEFLHRDNQAQISRNNKQIASLKKQLATATGPANSEVRAQLQSQIQSLQLANQTNSGSSAQIDPAQSASASRKSPVEYGILAALGSFIGAVLLAFVLERLDPRVKSVREAAMIYDKAVLATIAEDPDVNQFVEGRPATSGRSREAFRDLRIALELASGVDGARTILVTSAVAGEGKSTITRNLALALSEAGRRVAVVDADLRKPVQTKLFGVNPAAGFVDVLGGGKRIEDVMVTIDIVGSRRQYAKLAAAAGAASPHGPGFEATSQVSLLPAGTLPANPLAVLESKEFRSVLRYLEETFDTVLIDSAPVSVVSDAMPLAKLADAMVLVVRSSTDSRTARHTSDLLARVPNTYVAGVVMNAVAGSEAFAYGKGYGYAYYGYGRK